MHSYYFKNSTKGKETKRRFAETPTSSKMISYSSFRLIVASWFDYRLQTQRKPDIPFTCRVRAASKRNESSRNRVQSQCNIIEMSTKEVQYKDYVNFLDGYKNNANRRAINKPDDAVDNGSVKATSNLKPFNQYIEHYNSSRFKSVRPAFVNQQQQLIQDECKTNIDSIVRGFEKNSLESFTKQNPAKSSARSTGSSSISSSSSNSLTREFPLTGNGSISSSSRSSTASSINSSFKSTANSPSPNYSMTREFPLAGNGSLSSSRSSTVSSINSNQPFKTTSNSPSPNHSVSSEFLDLSSISPPPSIISSSEDSMPSPCNSPPPPPPPLPTVASAPPNFKSLPRKFVSASPQPVTTNTSKIQSNSPCQRAVKIQINGNDNNASKIIDQNDPRVKKAVYGALRNMYGAYHDKANEYVATLPKNRVKKGNNLDKIIDSIAADGGLEKLCGRAKIEAD
ncbi:unnamed protein product [Phyllotreta striolata]|uniref:Uncharacterized protein n=1 Tax=Phyllotreta striolata TaxID=444603 RepID=A0A9N9TNT8_PHYSR|nr:unnamed protein product [Phyllotreta striolata]